MTPKPHKVLVIRLSAMGDILLTTPVLRSLRRGLPHAEIHYLTKARFAEVLTNNPHIDRLWRYEGDMGSTLRALRAEGFDYVLDLHKNLRSYRIRIALGAPSSSFPKYNWTKLRMTRLRQRGRSVPHIVVRYGEALQPLGLALDGGGLEFPLDVENLALVTEQAHSHFGERPILAVVLGATWYTKRWPADKLLKFLRSRSEALVLLGGPAERAIGEALSQELSHQPHLNLAGACDLMTSAAWLQQAQWVLTHDTGLMHLAAALDKPMVTLWGNTVPEFGMAPWQAPHRVAQVMGLPCRPCSRIGYARCPKGHFACMTQLTPELVTREAKVLLKNIP